MAFQTLNRLKWKGGLRGCTVRIVHRGARGDRRSISGRDISGLRKSYLTVKKDGRETTIPLHRVYEIESRGRILWRRSTKKG